MSQVAIDKPKPYRLAPEAGGRFPDIGQLFSETMAEFMDFLGDYALLGLGHTLVVLPVVFGLVMFLYLGMTLAFLGGFMGSAVLAALASEGAGDDVGGLVGAGGMVGTIAFTVFVMFAAIGVAAALIAPITASVNRSVAKHQRGGGKMSFADAFSTALQDLVPVILIAGILVTGTFAGLALCYVPGLAFAMLLTFAPLLVHLHRQSAFAAFGAAVRDVMANPAWHVQFALIYFVVAMVASYIPVVGPMFLVALVIRAYRVRYGDAEEPATA